MTILLETVADRKDEIIICDWDGVLQNTEFIWAKNMLERKEIFEDVFNFSLFSENLFKAVEERNEYYLDKWLAEGRSIPTYIYERFLNCYLEDEMMYEKCPLTNMAQQLYLLSKQKFCKKIIILSHCITNQPDLRKVYKMKDIFPDNNPKINLVCISSGVKKEEWIKENCPDFTCFIDDRLDIACNLIDIYEGNNEPTILIPKYGFNQYPIDQKIREKGKEKNISIHYYRNSYELI
jgi:hypothetical protein